MDLSAAEKAARTALPPHLPSAGSSPSLLGHIVPRVLHVSRCSASVRPALQISDESR